MEPTGSEAAARALQSRLGGRWSVRALNASGFCNTWQAQGDGRKLFVKTMPAPRADALAAEADGLRALGATATIRVPQVVGQWTDEQGAQPVALLALEWLELRPAGTGFGERFGRALGALHGVPQARFGWHRDNLLGSTPQRNGWTTGNTLQDWLGFFAVHRLGALRERLAAQRASGALLDATQAVMAALPRFFDDGHAPRPSLVHGDLWSGNWSMLGDGTPVVYDPAVSCSDAEAELAMMELFGAPPAGFWPAYREAVGLHSGYERRRALYQLYHLLNHALLFGGGYHAQALRCARRLLNGG